MRALVYVANVEYATAPNRWNAPRAIDVSEQDVERGVALAPCRDCGGTGHYPMPVEKLDDFCVACKGQGLEPVMV